MLTEASVRFLLNAARPVLMGSRRIVICPVGTVEARDDGSIVIRPGSPLPFPAANDPQPDEPPPPMAA